MENKTNKTDEILNYLSDCAVTGKVLSPGKWVDLAQSLNALLGEETDKLHDLQQAEAKLRVNLIEHGKSVAAAETFAQASDEYKEMKRQSSRVSRIEEQIRIAKIQAKLKDTEYSYQ